MEKYPIDRMDLPEFITMNRKGQIVIDSRVKGWDALMPFIEDAVKWSGDEENDTDEEIDWLEVFEEWDAYQLKVYKSA